MAGFSDVLMMSSIITILFCIVKFVEMKFIDKELKPLKFVIRDAVIVYACSFVGIFGFLNMNSSLIDFMSVVTDSKTLNVASNTTQIFTDEPGF